MSDPSPPGVPPPAPAWTTPEFWTTVLVQVVALGTLAAHVLLRRDVAPDAFDAVLPALAILVAAVAHAVYLRSRRDVRLAHLLTVLVRTGTDAAQVVALARALNARSARVPAPAAPTP